MLFSPSQGRVQSIVTLMVASGVLYAASRVAAFVLSRADGSDPGRRAIAQWLPIAATVIVAILVKRADIAVAIIFGTSVACLSLVVGMSTYLTPLQALPNSRKAWPFVLPAALLALMAGFSAHFTWVHALMLLALGAAILPVWLDSPEESSEAAASPRKPGEALVVMIAVLAFIALGAFLAVTGTIASSGNTQMVSAGTFAATLLSPLLVLPTLGTASALGQRGHPGRALSAIVGTVLLNLCVLLPVAILLWYLSPSVAMFAATSDVPAQWKLAGPLPYAMATWRIETVFLVVLGFGLIPIAMGRWALGRLESALLVFGYAAYIVVLTVAGMG